MLAAPALTPLRPLASCSCPGAWCILLGGTSGSGALLTHRPQVWDPFPSARLGTDSLGDTDTPTRTETRGSERRRQAHTDTRSTHPCSPPLSSPRSISFLGCFLFPRTLLPQKSPKHAVGRPVRTPGKLPWVPSKAKGRSRGGKQREFYHSGHGTSTFPV